MLFFFFQAEDGIRDIGVTGVQTCALPILRSLMVIYSAPDYLTELILIATSYTSGSGRRLGEDRKSVV